MARTSARRTTLRNYPGVNMKLVPAELVHIIRPINDYLVQASRAFSRSVTKENNPLAVVPIPTQSGSNPSATTVFYDSQFRVINQTVASKTLGFDCSTIPASTLILLQVPATNGKLLITTSPASDLPAHASRHKSGGTDPIKLDELAAPTDVTTLNASTSAHGLLLKLDNNTAHFLRGDGTWANVGSGLLNSVDLTGQTGNITTTNITASAPQNGFYRVSVYQKTTTAGAAGDYVQITIGWNDGGAQTQLATMQYDYLAGTPTTAPWLDGLNVATNGIMTIYATSGTAITYATTVHKTGAPQYTLRLRLELVG